MRKIFTCCLSLLSLVVFGQVFPNSDTNGKKTVFKGTRCLATRSGAVEPLWVIDGIIAEPSVINTINPVDIESITILKDAAASTLFGCRAASGAIIIIITKSAREKRIYIKDVLTGSLIPAATVLFMAQDDRKDTLMFTTDENGLVVTDKLKTGQQYRIMVTSAGYKRLETNYNAIEKVTNFVLEKDIIECGPVAVHSPGITTCRRIYRTTAVYPNPVQRGNTLTVQLDNDRDGFIQVKVIGIDGRQLIMQTQKISKGTSRLFLNADNRWAAGVYFVQLSDENKKLVRQEKILVQ